MTNGAGPYGAFLLEAFESSRFSIPCLPAGKAEILYLSSVICHADELQASSPRTPAGTGRA
jgi:hypothetical protein